MNYNDPVPQPKKDQQNNTDCVPCIYKETIVKVPHPSQKELYIAFEWMRNQALSGCNEAGHVIMEWTRLKIVEHAAAELENWLYQNSGSTAEWPISIVTDNIESANKLVSLLGTLRSLNPRKESQQNT